MFSLESSFVFNIALLTPDYKFQAVVGEVLIKIFPKKLFLAVFTRYNYLWTLKLMLPLVLTLIDIFAKLAFDQLFGTRGEMVESVLF
jgi:hypothetical protein